MFPINYNDPYTKNDGSVVPVGDVIGGGGGGGGGATIYHGNTPPDASIGKEGDIFVYIPQNNIQDFTITIKKGLRGTSDQNYVGAHEIQLFLSDGTESKDIITFPNFYCNANSGNIADAFDGNTSGNYWESSSMPTIVNFGASIPPGWHIDKFVVWQRDDPNYHDVWKTFSLQLNGEYILQKTNLTQDDWAGRGLGTEFVLENYSIHAVGATYYKIVVNDEVIWVS